MAVIKCKMCGGDLELTEGMSVAECEYCGTKQTVPDVDSEKKFAMFNRANRLRLANEFDKAAGIYENIISEFNQEAEAYWGLVLCKCGIEYVDDPVSGKKIPTCHRASFNSVLEDSDFEQACENADAVARHMYHDEAKMIEEIRKGIIEVSGKEAPYDIFICYKETDGDGNRTIDSVLAQEVYDALTEKGYRVFFSRITLEDKLGAEYEPYIFAALNSAKVMLAFGTDYENYNAVWVKNEWSRFLKLMAQDKTKHLIPCYKGIDAYDMPKEFTKFQAQDMGKVGAVQDLLRGIEKLLPSKQLHDSKTNNDNNNSKNYYYIETEKCLKRGRLHLEDGEWGEAYDCFEDARISSDSDYQSIIARIGCICAELGIYQIEEFVEGTQILSEGVSHEQALSLVELKAGQLCLEKENWELADEHFGKAIEEDPECAEAYIGKMLAQYEMIDLEYFAENVSSDYIHNGNYKKALRFADSQLKEDLEQINQKILDREAEDRHKHEAKVLRRQKWLEQAAPLRGMISAGRDYTACVRSDGTVLATGKYEYVSGGTEWTYVASIAANELVGLRYDGSVVKEYDLAGIVALDNKGQNFVRKDGIVICGGKIDENWREIVAIATGFNHRVGLCKNGTVVAKGDNKFGQCNVSSWRDIASIFASDHLTVGLRTDGTVIATGINEDGQCNVSSWTNIVDIAVTDSFVVGLRSDGTVVNTLSRPGYQRKVSAWTDTWTDIAAIAATTTFIIGVHYDGTVVGTETGRYINFEYNISSWTDIVAVAASRGHHIVGIRADGTVVAAGENKDGQCNVFDWKVFNNLETLPTEKEAYRKVQEPQQPLLLKRYKELHKLRVDRSFLNDALFAGKRKKELDNRIAALEAEICKLKANGMK
ncbi:MAG: TIR domain-containing protein [Bacteroidales bacterium]|nr:TIR domain-containing protein [Lachnoclostridium sp.]MCM1383997.1 TIR domain-containing protein [Lachnoclostridium sp.]MCM1464705.1 TIR domain-containing protein [Bacteroidales bacterium]